MRFAVDIPNFGPWADPRAMGPFAAAVEAAGWDGLSIWDHVYAWRGNQVADPWVLLTAAASATDRIELISMVAAVPRYEPWELARRVVSLDLLSGGRFVFGVGIGHPPHEEFEVFGRDSDARRRADRLDESLAVMQGLWSGEPFSYQGEHYSVADVLFLPTPEQTPHPPIWVGAMWPNRRPARRAARYDGIAPVWFEDGEYRFFTPDVVAQVVAYVRRHRPGDDPFDVVVGGMTLDAPQAAPRRLEALAAAGATWWRESFTPGVGVEFDEWRERVLAGPPAP